jgi:hypothetical protein
MASVTSICNTALSHIGKDTISDIDEKSEEARQCKLHYSLTRDTMLQAFPWLFARKTQVLAEVANGWDERWQHAYTRPSDCLKVRRIVPQVDTIDEFDPIEFGSSEGLIYCNESPAKLEYTKRFEDPARFPPLFVDALCWALATKICLPLTKDQSLRKDAFQISNSTLTLAQVSDANEEQMTWDRMPSSIRARS